MALDSALLSVLACPEDKGPLLYFSTDAFLYNPRLKRRYRIDGGIPVMVIADAENLSADAHETLMQRAKKEGVRPTFDAT